MSWINKIQEAIDFIEKHLLEDMTIERVGKEINYSPSTFQNLFSAMTGYSINEYIRFRRLSCASDEILNGDISITQAAFKYGYENVESFSRAFKRLFGYPPSSISKSNSNHQKFIPIKITYDVAGGFCMKRNFIPGLSKVDWSDTQRQNEFVNSIVSALGALGEKIDYDYVCAVSGCAFRTSFSISSALSSDISSDISSDNKWNHGNYHVINVPIIIEHTFKMLGYKVTHHIRSNYEYDKKLIVDSIDKGIPVITLEGVINCSDACVISGYDNDGNVLLGYNPFMYINDDHNEAPDDTGYFRKSDWHGEFCANGSQ